MGREDPRKIAAALAVLVLALGLLGFQLYRRVNPRPSAAAPGAAPAVEEAAAATERPFATSAAVGVTSPVRDVAAALERNPFLRPAGSRSRTVATATTARRSRPQLTLTGVRTGSRPMAIIDDRTLHIGDTVRGWTVRSIGRDRVTLENPDGTTFDLDLR